MVFYFKIDLRISPLINYRKCVVLLSVYSIGIQWKCNVKRITNMYMDLLLINVKILG